MSRIVPFGVNQKRVKLQLIVEWGFTGYTNSIAGMISYLIPAWMFLP